MQHSEVKPYNQSNATKKQEVADMFDNIAKRYDFLNRFLSMRVDNIWRKKVVKTLSSSNPKHIVDLATGTGDLAIALAKLKPESIVGFDISKGMLEMGEKKIEHKQLKAIISLRKGDAEHIPLNSNTTDAATVAFGVRNFENPLKGLQEIYRVLKPNGTVAILEFSKPKKFPIKQLYNLYFKRILPACGRAISRDKAAYTYLPDSVDAFLHGDQFCALLQNAGFRHCNFKSLTFGIAALYTAKK